MKNVNNKFEIKNRDNDKLLYHKNKYLGSKIYETEFGFVIEWIKYSAESESDKVLPIQTTYLLHNFNKKNKKDVLTTNQYYKIIFKSNELLADFLDFIEDYEVEIDIYNESKIMCEGYLFSNCCSALLEMDDICSLCKEHADTQCSDCEEWIDCPNYKFNKQTNGRNRRKIQNYITRK